MNTKKVFIAILCAMIVVNIIVIAFYANEKITHSINDNFVPIIKLIGVLDIVVWLALCVSHPLGLIMLATVMILGPLQVDGDVSLFFFHLIFQIGGAVAINEIKTPFKMVSKIFSK